MLKDVKTYLQPKHAFDWRLGVNLIFFLILIYFFLLDTYTWRSKERVKECEN